jgi:hypothetical protein
MIAFLVPYNCYQVHDMHFKTIQPFETRIVTKRYHTFCSYLTVKPKKMVAGWIPDRFIGSFHLINPSGRTMALRTTHLLI